MVHGAKQQKYDYGNDVVAAYEELIKREPAADVKTPELGRVMLRHYKLWLGTLEKTNSEWRDSNLRYIATEAEFDGIPLLVTGDGEVLAEYAGRYDGVVEKMDDGTYWLIETKTTHSIKALESDLVMDDQSAMYLWAAQKRLGVEISGVLFDLMWKRKPDEAKIIYPKGGGDPRLSVDQSMVTSWEWYAQNLRDLAAVGEMDLNETYKAHGEFLEFLWREHRERFFKRVPIRKTRKQLDILANEVALTASEMIRSDLPIFRSMTVTPFLNCKLCKFRTPCLALGAGSDFEVILENDYEPRSAYDDELNANVLGDME